MSDAVIDNVTDAGKITKFKAADLAYALDNAAEFLKNEEWPERDGGQQVAANREAAKRISKMAKRQWALASK